jgi:4-amino-4-deoxy-L-arabinose transferase-like glycosyltransferase
MLRGAQYYANRSLWYDEANLARNIVDRSFAGLLQPLDYDQGAPIGFLMLEKLAGRLAGYSEYGLRLVPLLCGLLSLVLFYTLARRYLDRRAALVALYLFAFSETLIYHGSELKQYSSDVAVALALLLLADRLDPDHPSRARMFMLGCAGAAAIWLSFPAVFVLGGIGLAYLLSAAHRKQARGVWKFLAVGGAWAASFALNYRFFLRPLHDNGSLAYYWQAHSGFMPLPPRSTEQLEWFLFAFFDTFADPGGLKLFWLELSGLAALPFLVGCQAMLRDSRRRLFMLVLPAGLALLASGIHQYPFSGRTILFIAPALLLLIGAGIAEIWAGLGGRASIAGAVLVAILLVPLSFNAVKYVATPRTREELRSTLIYVKAHYQPGDVLYVYPGAQPAFAYYVRRLDLDLPPVLGIDADGDWSAYRDDLEQLRGHRRVWLLFSHVRVSSQIDEEQLMLYQLGSMARRLDSFGAMGAAVYLYDLSQSR